jgi:membrane protein
MAKARSRDRGHWASFKALVDLWVELFNKHNLLTYASAIAFQTFVAVVALLLLVLGVLGEIGRQDVWTKQIAPEIEPKVLHQVFEGINATVDKIFGSSSIGLIVFASLLTIWETSGVVRACMGAFAQIYEDEETRPWWIRFPISFGISIVLTAGVLGALLLTTAARTAVHGSWGIPFAVARWLFALVLLTLAFGILVRYAPVKPRTSRWASGGAVLCVVAWTVQSLIFAEYLRTFANYKTAAGSLLGIYFVTTFLYVAAIILMVGVELDEQLREDVSEGEERGILELVKDVL